VKELCEQSLLFAITEIFEEKLLVFWNKRWIVCWEICLVGDQGMPRTWRLALEAFVNCRGNIEYKLLTETGFICSKAPATAALLRLEVKDTHCI
jgi:hypothetical protein